MTQTINDGVKTRTVYDLDGGAFEVPDDPPLPACDENQDETQG